MSQLKKGIVLSYIKLGLNNLVGLLYVPYMLYMMGKSEYGLYSLVASVIAYLTIFDFGFGNAIVRYTAKFRAEGKVEEQYSMFGMFVLMYSAIGFVVFLLGLLLYFNVDIFFGNSLTPEELSKAKILMLLMVINLAFTFPLSIFGAIIKAYEDFVFTNIVAIVRIALNTIIMVLLLKLGYRAIGMVVLATILNFATLIINLWYSKKKFKIKIHFIKVKLGFVKEVLVYSFYVFLNSVMDRIYWSSGQFILGSTAGTFAVAVYSVAIQLQQIYMSFSGSIVGVLLPKVTKMITNNTSNKDVSDLFIRTGRLQFIIMSFILSGFITFGKPFISFWAGDGYEEVYIITLLFLIPLTVPLIQNLGIMILMARNEMKFRSYTYLIIALFGLILQYFLSIKYGTIGAAIGVAVSLSIGQILIMNIYYYKKQFIDIIEFWKEIGKMSVTPIIFLIISYYLRSIIQLDSIFKLGIGIIIFTILYFPVFWLLSMNESERKIISKPINSILIKFSLK